MNRRNLMSPIFRHNDYAIERIMDSQEYFIRHLERAVASAADESIFPHRGGRGGEASQRALSTPSPLQPVGALRGLVRPRMKQGTFYF